MASFNLNELAWLGAVTTNLIISLLVFGYVSVGLRLWARCRVTKSPGWDDVAMVATLLLFTTYCAFILAIRLRVKNDKFFTQESIRTTLLVCYFETALPIGDVYCSQFTVLTHG